MGLDLKKKKPQPFIVNSHTACGLPALKNELKGALWIGCVGLKFSGLFTSVRWELKRAE